MNLPKQPIEIEPISRPGTPSTGTSTSTGRYIAENVKTILNEQISSNNREKQILDITGEVNRKTIEAITIGVQSVYDVIRRYLTGKQPE